MSDFPLSILALIFAAVLLLGFGAYLLLRHRSEHQETLQRIQQSGEEPPPEAAGGDEAPKTNFLVSLLESLGQFLGPKKNDETSYGRLRFVRAGLRGANVPLIFLGAKITLAVAAMIFVIGLKLSFLQTLPSLQTMGLFLGIALAGFYLPNVWLRMRIDKRRETIVLGLPDALDLMVVCVEAGIGLDAAIYRVGEEMKLGNPVLSQEFHLLNLELKMGKQRREALKNLAQRTDAEEVSNLTAMLAQTEKFGTSVAQALRVHSDAVRTKRYQKAEELAAKLPVKLLFPMILFIFPALFVAIMGPAVIRIFRTLFPALSGG